MVAITLCTHGARSARVAGSAAAGLPRGASMPLARAFRSKAAMRAARRLSRRVRRSGRGSPACPGRAASRREQQADETTQKRPTPSRPERARARAHVSPLRWPYRSIPPHVGRILGRCGAPERASPRQTAPAGPQAQTPALARISATTASGAKCREQRAAAGEDVVAVEGDARVRRRQQALPPPLFARASASMASPPGRRVSAPPVPMTQPAGGQVAAARDRLPAGRRVEVRELAGVALHAGDGGEVRQRRAPPRSPPASSGSGRRQVHRPLRRRQHLGDVRGAHVGAEVALDRALAVRLRLGRERRDLRAAVGDRVHVGGGAADVDDDEVADVLGEPLGGDEDGARRGQDAAGHELADALHARRVRDVLLEGVVDDGARRHDVELVDRRIDVAGDRTRKPAPSSSSCGVVADHGVAARRRRSAAPRAPRGARR